ncbi:hypothetical protein B0H14DRAFT_2602574 [Mycena olivaceomarginata]|nr:hypothetical protein B0H14DRAFT_2602574 [Mycena olivaceomarginata]
MSQNSGKQLNNWPLLAGLALLLYDYLLTLPSEIHIVWPWPKPWFILVRYLALSTNFTMVVLTFGTFESQVCGHHETTSSTVHFAGTDEYDIVTYAILTLRVYALFNRNRVILGLLSLGGLGTLAIGACSGSEAPPTLQFRSPEICASFLMSRVAGVSEAGLFRDLLIFAFTLLRGILHWRHENYHSQFVNCFVLDGFVYFCHGGHGQYPDLLLIFAHQFGDVDWLTHGKPLLAGSFAWLASALSAVLTARLILNMRKVADTDGMAVGGVASEDANTVEWNDIDGTPMEHIRGHVRNRASWVYGNDLEAV